MSKDIQKIFDEYVGYCTYSRRLRPETIRGYKEAFRHLTNLMPDIKSPVDINADNMNYFFKKLHTRKRIVGKDTVKVGVKASTIMTYWSKLNSFFSWLEENKYLGKGENPLPSIRPPEPEYEDKKALSKSDLDRLYGAIDRKSTNLLLNKRDKAMVDMLFFCGLRKGEFVSLLVSDINFNRGIITVRGKISKSKKTRQLPMHPVLGMHLEDYMSERNKRNYKTEYLFVSNNSDRGLSTHGLKHWVKRLNEVSGVKFHLHQFRHTFATHLAKKNVDVIQLQRLLGHTDLRMTQRYLRSWSVEDLRNDINKLDIDNLD